MKSRLHVEVRLDRQNRPAWGRYPKRAKWSMLYRAPLLACAMLQITHAAESVAQVSQGLRMSPWPESLPSSEGAAATGRAVTVLPDSGVAERPTTLRSSGQLSGLKPVELLLLDLVVNGQPQAGVARVEQSADGRFLMAADAWTAARLAPLGSSRALTDGSAGWALDSLAGASFTVNRQAMSLQISAPAAAFVGSKLSLPDGAQAMPPRPQPGVVMNYDVSVVRDGPGRLTGGATLEAMAFNKNGNFVTSALVRDLAAGRKVERLDTFWRYDMPERMETLVVGDTIGVSGGWSRPVRYAGVRWGRDFEQNPGFVTRPQIGLRAEAALPSTVEVLVNNARRMSEQVAPGPFEIGNLPVVTGAGEVNLIVRDLLGRETVVRQSYYSAPRLLATGMTDFSLEAGRLRSGYGQDSHYEDAFGAATWRQGLSDTRTVEGRLELQAHRRAAGLELTQLIGGWAVGRLALAASASSTQGVNEHGSFVKWGVERSTPTGGGALQYEHASRGFAPFGESINAAARVQRSRESWLGTVGGQLWGRVSGGLSYASQSRWDGERVSSLGLSVGFPLFQRANLDFSLNKRLDGDGSWRASVNLNLPLENGLSAGSRAQWTGDGQHSATVFAARNAPAGPGTGWLVEASTLQSQAARGSLQVNTNQAEMGLDLVSSRHGELAARAGVRGSVGMLAGLPFASRPIGQGSFAVVEVEAAPGIPIMRSNQVVATTDHRGLAFVPGLLPWQKNQLTIDPVDLPLDAESDGTVREVTPYAGSGAFVKFAVKRSRQALLTLHQRDGIPVPQGSKVRLLPDGPEFVAGLRGQVWLTDLPTGAQRLQVSWPAGGCALELALPAAQESMPDSIGPLLCTKEK